MFKQSNIENDLSFIEEELIFWKPENRSAYFQDMSPAIFLAGLEINAQTPNNAHQVNLWTDLFREKLALMPVVKGNLATMKNNFIDTNQKNPEIDAKTLKRVKSHLDMIQIGYYNWNNNSSLNEVSFSSPVTGKKIAQNWKDIQKSNHNLMNNSLASLSEIFHPKTSFVDRMFDNVKQYLLSA